MYFVSREGNDQGPESESSTGLRRLPREKIGQRDASLDIESNTRLHRDTRADDNLPFNANADVSFQLDAHTNRANDPNADFHCDTNTNDSISSNSDANGYGNPNTTNEAT
jgi:hypothetical protein